MKVERQLAGYEDLARLPESVRAEVLSGELIVHPSPDFDHQSIVSALTATVHSCFGDPYVPDGWWIIPDVDVRLTPQDIVRPDISGWRRSRLSRSDARRPVDVVPDWTCEVLSPSNAGHDLVKKRALYARSGVGHYWIVDPSSRTLTALELRSGQWVELGAWDDTAVVRIAPFEAIEIDTSRLFPPLSDAVHEG